MPRPDSAPAPELAADVPGVGDWGRLRVACRRIRAAVERVVGTPIPLAPLLPRAERRAPGSDPLAAIRYEPDAHAGLRGAGLAAVLTVPEAEVRFEVPVPEDGRFIAEVGVAPEDWPRTAAGVEFRVEVLAGPETHVVAWQECRPLERWVDRRWRRLVVDLSPWSRRTVTLALCTRAPGGGTTGPVRAWWGEPRVCEARPWPRVIARLWAAARARGWRGTLAAVRGLWRGRLAGADPQALYRWWLERHALSADAHRRLAAEIVGWGREAPRLAVATAVCDPPRDALERCLASVRAQLYPHWEFCLYDDASRAPHVRELLTAAAAADPRIRVRFGETRGGIATAGNQAWGMATAAYVAWLDHDDELAPEALAAVAACLRGQPDADVVYTDEDKLEPDGRRSTPHFKPDWSPELLRSGMYTCHLGVYRRALLEALGGFRPEFEGAQDYDLMLRAVETGARVAHVPRVLYHWRKGPGSTAAAAAAKPGAVAAGRRALEAHLARVGLPGGVEDTAIPGIYRARPRVAPGLHVTIVIPTRDQPALLRRCLASLAATVHPAWSVVLVDNGTRDADALDLLARSGHPVVRDGDPFNFSRLVNRGVAAARGPFVLLLNNDTEALSPGWLTALLEVAQDPAVGAVGAKLCYPDGRIQHAGVILGAGGVANHAGRLLPREAFGHLGALAAIRNYSAVTAACMLVRRTAFDAVGGFDERLAVSFNDVDFCLRVQDAGFRVAWTPHAELLHHESASRVREAAFDEIHLMQTRWGPRLARDPFYNPNCSLERADWSVAW